MTIHKMLFLDVDYGNFQMIKDGRKKIETRVAHPKYQDIREGDVLEFTCKDESIEKVIQNIHHWKSVDEMLDDFSVNDIMPNIDTKEALLEAYDSYPNYKENMEKYGIFGFLI